MDWKKIVGTVAPTIATALGGPLAGLGVKAIAEVFGLGEGVTESEVAKAVMGANPDQLLALKQADQTFAARMKELDIDLERIHAGDRDSARQREVQTGDSWTNRILAGGVSVMAGGVAWAILSGYTEGLKDPMTAAIVGGVVTQAFAALMQVLNYYFGSSAGSAKKDETIKTLTR